MKDGISINENKEIIIQKQNTAEFINCKKPSPKEDEVLLKMCFSAISAGTERAILTGLVSKSIAIHNNETQQESDGFPAYAGGYSGSAIVCEIGSKITKLKVGDRVMVHGAGHRLYSAVKENECLIIPDKVEMSEAALTIVSGFSLAAVRKAKIELGESCMVVGLGLLGLFSIQFAVLSGAMPVIAVDFNAERRKLALELGADYALDPADPKHKEIISEITHGKGADSVIEVTGNGDALNQALQSTARFGRVILLGCTRLSTNINFYFDVHCPGIQLIGAHSGARPKIESQHGSWTEMDDSRAILEYLSSGRISFKKFISEIHSPDEANEIYNRLANDKNFPIGVLFDWSKIAQR